MGDQGRDPILNSSLRDAGQPRIGDEPASGAARLIPPGLDAVLVLLRHGQTQFIVEKRFQGAMEAPLTELCERQARLAGRKLADPVAPPSLPIPATEPFAIVHSPLGRARRSAELAVAEMNAAGRATPPLRADAGFCEIAQGKWEGLTEKEITARFGDSLPGWRRWPERFHAEGGEDLRTAWARAESALTSLLDEMAADRTPGTHDRHQVLGYGDTAPDTRPWSLIVAHGGIFKVVACVLLGLPMENFWNFDFGLGAIAVIEIRAGRAVLRTVNFEAHLDDESESAAAESSERNASGAL
jgi:broad specificity phosphatase PhoE